MFPLFSLPFSPLSFSFSLTYWETKTITNAPWPNSRTFRCIFTSFHFIWFPIWHIYTAYKLTHFLLFIVDEFKQHLPPYTAHRPRINSARKRQADSREMWINVFVIAEHNFSGNLLSPSLILYYLTPSLSYSLFFSLRHCCPYLHTIRVACREHERPIQIEYLRETKHASDILLRAHERALLFRKFVSPRTRINARNRPP